jgi:hypothetical protein
VSVRELNVVWLARSAAGGHLLLLVDVRRPAEVAVGMLPGMLFFGFCQSSF